MAKFNIHNIALKDDLLRFVPPLVSVSVPPHTFIDNIRNCEAKRKNCSQCSHDRQKHEGCECCILNLVSYWEIKEA